MRARFSLLIGACVLSLVGTASAQDLPTTHDCGITITPDDLTSSIQETQDFWGPVRKHLLSQECEVGQAGPRTEAAVYLKSVHDALHDRLFGQGEEEAKDLIHYLGHRLRMFETLRRLRVAVADDAVLYALIQKWHDDLWNIHKLPEAEQVGKVDALARHMTDEMKARGLDEARVAEAAKQWAQLATIDEKMAATAAGRMMIHFENKAADLNPQVSETLRQISEASDWVLITRETGREIGRADFLKAHSYLNECRTKQAAAVGTGVNR